MHVFVTGASGWVGSAVVKELLAAGHAVTGMVRDPAKAAGLSALGAQVLQATLDDLDVLASAASRADAVAHLAFNHDFSRFAANAEQDRKAILALGMGLEGTQRPLLVTTGLAFLAPGRLATEEDRPSPQYLRKSEHAAQELAKRGVRAATVRLAPTVHGLGEHGFVTALAAMARGSGVSAYPGEGLNRWSGVHRLDAARLYRLALEQGAADPVYHAAAEEGVSLRDLATALGRVLGLPVESREPEHFAWLGDFVSADAAASSAFTRERLGWEPSGPDLLTDISQPGYFA